MAQGKDNKNNNSNRGLASADEETRESQLQSNKIVAEAMLCE